MQSVARSIAYVAGVFPFLSETFVYREVQALRNRGWAVQTVSLAEPGRHGGEFEALAATTLVVYQRWLRRAAAELVRWPLQSLRTLWTAGTDALMPGEPLSVVGRLKLLAQGLAGLALAHALRPAGVKHLHAHFAHAPTSVAMYAAIQLGIGFSFTGHANDLFQRRALLRRKLQRASFVSCISLWHREFYREIEPDPAGKYRLIRCAVDVAAWAPRTHDADHETADRLEVLTVCRLVEKKGVDTLVRAVGWLRRQGWPVHLTVAGDGPMRAALEALAVAEGCDGAITWRGATSNAQVRDLMARADVFALPCRSDTQGDRDGIPVVLMEAMACGLPVVSGDLPAIRELIQDGETGLLVTGGDTEAVVDRLDRLGRDRDLRTALGSAGRDHVIGEFSADVNIDRLEDALRGAGCRSTSKTQESCLS